MATKVMFAINFIKVIIIKEEEEEEVLHDVLSEVREVEQLKTIIPI